MMKRILFLCGIFFICFLLGSTESVYAQKIVSIKPKVVKKTTTSKSNPSKQSTKNKADAIVKIEKERIIELEAENAQLKITILEIELKNLQAEKTKLVEKQQQISLDILKKEEEIKELNTILSQRKRIFTPKKP